MLMFSIILQLPLLEYSTYWDNLTSWETGLNLLENNPNKVQSFIDFHEIEQQPLLYLSLNNKTYLSDFNEEDYRSE